MKKRVLFGIPSFGSGGAEKSLITLLSLFDYEKYDVDLISFRHDGLFFDKIPKRVRVLGDSENYEAFDGSAINGIKYFIKKRMLSSAIDRIKYAHLNNKKGSYDNEKKRWALLRNQLPEIDGHYECSIGYLEGNASYFAVYNVNADKKICYVHNDFKKLGLDERMSQELFEKADEVVTVSQQCLCSLKSEFPDLAEKFSVIENITSPALLIAQAGSEKVYDNHYDETVLLTVGRLTEQKAMDLAVKSCAELKKRGKKIRWYQIGSGSLEQELKALVTELNVEKEFIMLGERSNPYPYMGQCDIYVQTSRYEGKSIAIDEAKCLCCPIVVTNFSTVFDQINDGINGLICNMNEQDIADKIEILIDDPKKRQMLSDNLKKEKTGNEDEVYKLYKLIDE